MLTSRIFSSMMRDFDREFSRLPSMMFGPLDARSSRFPMLTSNKGSSMMQDFTSPNVNLAETKSDFVVEAELPGLKKEDVTIELSPDNRLLIKGKMENKFEEGKKPDSTEEEASADGGYKYWHVERQYGEFERVVSFPSDIVPEDVSAEFKNGLLTVKLPKMQKAIEEESKPKRIAIAG